MALVCTRLGSPVHIFYHTQPPNMADIMNMSKQGKPPQTLYIQIAMLDHYLDPVSSLVMGGYGLISFIWQYSWSMLYLMNGYWLPLSYDMKQSGHICVSSFHSSVYLHYAIISHILLHKHTWYVTCIHKVGSSDGIFQRSHKIFPRASVLILNCCIHILQTR